MIKLMENPKNHLVMIDSVPWIIDLDSVETRIVINDDVKVINFPMERTSLGSCIPTVNWLLENTRPVAMEWNDLDRIGISITYLYEDELPDVFVGLAEAL